MTYDTFISMINNRSVLFGLGGLIFLLWVLPTFWRSMRFIRCPKCGAWFRLDCLGFDMRQRATGHSGTTFGGGLGVFLLLFVFDHVSRHNADPSVREWGTARLRCKKCACAVAVDARRDLK